MKMLKKIVITFFLCFVVLSMVPYTSQGIIFHSSTKGLLTPVANNVYLLTYKDATISNDHIISNDLRARRCLETPTEFQTIESNDSLITNYEIEYPLNYVPDDHEATHLINQTALVYFNEIAYVFMAAEQVDNGNLTFFLSYSEDDGVTWSDLIWLYNSSAQFLNYYWLDASHTSTTTNRLVLAYSYERAPTYIDATRVLTINPSNLQIVDTFDLIDANFYGTDFEFFFDENGNQLYCTMTDLMREQVKIARINTLDFTFFTGVTNFVDPVHVRNGAEVNITLFHPSLTYWDLEEKYVLVAQDTLIDIYDIAQGIVFEEYFLWAAVLDQITSSPTRYFNVSKALSDGYYRMEPSVSIYEDYLFVAFEVGEGHRYGGGWPDVAFSFSKDGKIWTDNYLGGFTFYSNLGTYFALATVGCFAIVLPTYYFISKNRKLK
ncbi:MAG: hypothetical protein ACFFDS_05945 [Candidatus Thorarchaeota archaeon]